MKLTRLEKRFIAVIFGGLGLMLCLSNAISDNSIECIFIGVLSLPLFILGMFILENKPKSIYFKERILEASPTILGVLLSVYILAFHNALYYFKVGVAFVLFASMLAAFKKINQKYSINKRFRFRNSLSR